MRISLALTIVVALLALVVVGVLGAQIIQPARALLADVSVTPDRITPNADGSDDVADIRYTLNRPARLSILFTDNQSGAQYHFRDDEARPPEAYTVQFSGVVDGFTLPGETVAGTIERRLIPDGEYTWTIEARGEG
ncbi:MAG: hypothetical protein IT323_20755, partial [Anaerolineae bacterium]|nr:hypothetical protein [Anaerolineae bacterium]